LRHRQLLAAMLIVRGQRTGRIARQLQIERHTLARWKRLPLFQAELKRLSAHLAAHVFAPMATDLAPPKRSSARPVASAAPRRLLSPAEVAARDPAFAAALRRRPTPPVDPEFEAAMADLKAAAAREQNRLRAG
jgi:hypothetical protein